MIGNRAGKATMYDEYLKHNAKHAAKGVNAQFHLNAAVDGAERKMWPTPTRHARESSPHRDGGPSLATAVQNWPTPNSRDWKDTGPTQGNRKSPNLGTMVHTAGPPAPAIPSTDGNTRGSLNSRWVAQLMGFPCDWCVLPIETPSAATATPSSPKSPR